ncbi:MAG: tripartite tricarboxylate transporter permease [Pseudomonadota bacterium]
MLESLSQALGNFTDPWIWVWIVGGVLWGLVFGLIPGVGSLTAMALFLPFVFKLEVLQAMPLMVALSAVGFNGGAITAILIGVPGEPPNVATTFDGYPMTQKGEGARAIGAALTSSLLGGVAAAFLALGMVFAVLPLVMAFTSMEMVFIILIGLAFISVLGKGSRLKGLISGGLGLMISSVGMAVVTGEPRFTFGIAFLYEGLHIVPVSLGLFAVPPMVDLALKGGSGTIAAGKVIFTEMKDVWRGAKDVFSHKMLWLRSTIIGYLFGVIPGVGASAAVFVAYGQAKKTSKRSELFGTGIVEGVIAPESCNNAKESGSWLTTLVLGIPGSGTGAMALGGLIMLGIFPGPTMLTEHMDLSLTLILILAVSNLIGAAICFLLAPHLAPVARTPGRVLIPIVLVVIFAGSYAYEGKIEDIIILLIFSMLGMSMRRFGYNTASLFLGYILGALFENYLFVSLQLGGALFFLRPICLFLIFFLIAFFLYGPMIHLIKGWIRKGGVKI